MTGVLTCWIEGTVELVVTRGSVTIKAVHCVLSTSVSIPVSLLTAAAVVAVPTG